MSTIEPASFLTSSSGCLRLSRDTTFPIMLEVSRSRVMSIDERCRSAVMNSSFVVSASSSVALYLSTSSDETL